MPFRLKWSVHSVYWVTFCAFISTCVPGAEGVMCYATWPWHKYFAPKRKIYFPVQSWSCHSPAKSPSASWSPCTSYICSILPACQITFSQSQRLNLLSWLPNLPKLAPFTTSTSVLYVVQPLGINIWFEASFSWDARGDVCASVPVLCLASFQIFCK